MSKIKGNKNSSTKAVYEQFVNISGGSLLSPKSGLKDIEVDGLLSVHRLGEIRDIVNIEGRESFFVNIIGSINSSILVRASSGIILASNNLILASDGGN
jgi:hypothetical protein